MKLTPARRRALEILAIEGLARRSNATDGELRRDSTGIINRRIYWQSADWLVSHGLATARSWYDGGTYAGADELIEITDAGREALR